MSYFLQEKNQNSTYTVSVIPFGIYFTTFSAQLQNCGHS